jgi:hypothetical protein
MSFYYGRNAVFKRALAVAIAFTTLSLLPAIGIAGKFDDGNMGLPTAYAQFNTPEVNQEEANTTAATTSIQNASTSSNNLLLRGLIGTMISVEGANATDSDNSDNGQAIQGDYAVAGRWRMFANESLVQRFVANFTLAKTDGSEYHNIIIENIGRDSEFARNTASITAQVYANSTVPSTIMPITIEIRDKVLSISDIEIDGRTIEDERQQDILQIIDGQQIYGMTEFQGRG